MSDDEAVISPYLPETQTPSNSQPSQEIRMPWGHLISCIATLPSVDLRNEVYTFGRAPECNIRVNPEHVSHVTSISKCHFRIMKKENLIYMTDLSKNGTFVNGVLVGRDATAVLYHEDVIATGTQSFKTFILSIPNIIGTPTYLPDRLRRTYTVCELLGRGAFGEVRRAIHKITRERLAVKKIVMRTSGANNRSNPSRYVETEIEILRSLSHPFIIRLHDVIRHDREVFLILDFMTGGDLTNRIHSLTEEESKFIAYQILLGVRYLHAKNVIHRDLKPENILLSQLNPFPRIKISDFGLSKILDENRMMETICGTLSHVAPEILLRFSKYDHKIDNWSFGVILFTMLSKSLPFLAPDAHSVSLKIVSGNITWIESQWEHISDRAKDLVKKILVVDARQRLDIEPIIQHPWLSRSAKVLCGVHQLMQVSSSGSSDDFPMPSLKKQKLNSPASDDDD